MEQQKNQADLQLWSRISELREEGLSQSQIARHLQISGSTVKRLCHLTFDELLARQSRQRTYPRKLDKYENLVKSLLTVHPYLSSIQILERIQAHDPHMPYVCGKTVLNYTRYIREKYNLPFKEHPLP